MASYVEFQLQGKHKQIIVMCLLQSIFVLIPTCTSDMCCLTEHRLYKVCMVLKSQI